MLKKVRKILRINLKRSIDEKYNIKKEELFQFIKEGTIIIDVRSPQEFKEEHIDGAINLPYYNVNKDAEKILKNKNEKIIVYCSTGQRSRKVQEKLNKLGYKNVYNLYEGM